MILAPGDRIGRIDVDMLPPEVTGGGAGDGVSHTPIMGSPLREARESFAREYLTIQIRRFSGNISRTASFIGTLGRAPCTESVCQHVYIPASAGPLTNTTQTNTPYNHPSTTTNT